MTTAWALAEQISSQVACFHGDAAEDGNGHVLHNIPSQFVLPLHKRASPPYVADVDLRGAAAIPVIDLALSSGGGKQFHERVRSVCEEWGLFHVVNHGVPDAVLQGLQAQIEGFLALPVADRCPRFLGNRGEGYGSGFVRRSTGVTEWRDCLRLHTFPPSGRNYDLWPLNPLFRKALEDYADEMRSLQLRMLGCMSESLGLAPTRLEEIVGEMQQTILMNHYPPCPQPELTVGVDAHADVGAITCLWQYDDVVGLHVLHQGSWLPVNPPPGSLTILVGAQVEIASNGIYKSPIHKGVVNPSRHRVSVVSFYQLKPNQVVAPAKELLDEQHPSIYQPTRFKDHELANK